MMFGADPRRQIHQGALARPTLGQGTLAGARQGRQEQGTPGQRIQGKVRLPEPQGLAEVVGKERDEGPANAAQLGGQGQDHQRRTAGRVGRLQPVGGLGHRRCNGVDTKVMLAGPLQQPGTIIALEVGQVVQFVFMHGASAFHSEWRYHERCTPGWAKSKFRPQMMHAGFRTQISSRLCALVSLRSSPMVGHVRRHPIWVGI
ncbi:hypothetical protein RY27_25030 [Litorilinea aerophila]|nr:hypothetical protein RY27_25030 [Litorilinea aerophila]